MQALSLSFVVHQSSTVGPYEVPSKVSSLHGRMQFIVQACSTCHWEKTIPWPLEVTGWGPARPQGIQLKVWGWLWILGGALGNFSEVPSLNDWIGFAVQFFGSHCWGQMIPWPVRVFRWSLNRPQGTYLKVQDWLGMLGRVLPGSEQGAEIAWLEGVCCACLWLMPLMPDDYPVSQGHWSGCGYYYLKDL